MSRAPKAERRRDLLRRADDVTVRTKRVRVAAHVVQGNQTVIEACRLLTRATGRPRVLSWQAFFGLLLVHAQRGTGSMVITEILLTGLGLTSKQKALLGVPEHLEYHHVEGNLTDLERAFAPQVDQSTGELKPAVLPWDHDLFVSHVCNGVIPEFLGAPRAVALDGIAIESPYRIRTRSADWAADISDDLPPTDKPSPRRTTHPDDVPAGSDGRKQFTADPDARAGHRTARQGDKSQYIGYMPTTVVAVPEVGGAAVPAVVRAIQMAPAGSSAGAAGLRSLDLLPVQPDQALSDRIFNYSRTYGAGLVMRGIDPVVDLHKTFRGVKPGPRDRVIVIDQDFYTDAIPAAERSLPVYAQNMTQAQRLALASRYDARARFAFTPQGRADRKSGKLRFRGPALTGRVRCINTPASMRAKHGPKRPTTACQKGAACSCGTTFVAELGDYARNHRRELYGTTPWLKSYGRRNAIESSNAEVRWNRTTLTPKAFLTRGLIKIALLFGFFNAGVNILILEDWYSQHWLDLIELPAEPPKFQRHPVKPGATHRLAPQRE